MEWFSMGWVFGILAVACGIFFTHMVIDYNTQRGRIVPALGQVLEIRKRHETEIEKADQIIKEAEERLAELKQEEKEVADQIKAIEAEVVAHEGGESLPT
jgi:hypothetical protein